jgi:hypothetical protein
VGSLGRSTLTIGRVFSQQRMPVEMDVLPSNACTSMLPFRFPARVPHGSMLFLNDPGLQDAANDIKKCGCAEGNI